MSRLKRAVLTGAVTATVAAGACKESTAPAPPVDPVAMAAGVTTLNTTFSQNQVFQGLAALDGTGPLGTVVARVIAPSLPVSASGATWLTATTTAVQTRADLEALAQAPAAVQALFFSNLLGKTFQWDATAPAGYRITDSTLAGAPSNGVRFLIYEVDTTGMPVLPLVQTGYLDLSDESNPSVNTLRVLLKVGSQTAANYTISENKTTTSLTLTAAGSVTNVVSAGATVTFNLSHVLALADSSLSTDYEANDGATSVSLISKLTSPGGVPTLTMDWSATKGGTVEIVGTNSAPFVNLAFKFNGNTIATVTGSQANPVVTPLTAPLAQLSTILIQLSAIYVNLTLLFVPGLLVFF